MFVYLIRLGLGHDKSMEHCEQSVVGAKGQSAIQKVGNDVQ